MLSGKAAQIAEIEMDICDVRDYSGCIFHILDCSGIVVLAAHLILDSRPRRPRVIHCQSLDIALYG